MNPNHTKTEHDPILSLRLPREILLRIDALAKETGLSRSSIVRTALISGLPTAEKIASLIRQHND